MAKRPDAKTGSVPDYQSLASFRYAIRRFLSFSAAAARQSGLSPQQHQALLAVKGFPSHGVMSVGELAERLDLRHHSAVGLVDRLGRKGLLQRKRDLKDRRRVHVCLTTQGERVLERLSGVHCEELRRMGPELRILLGKLGR